MTSSAWATVIRTRRVARSEASTSRRSSNTLELILTAAGEAEDSVDGPSVIPFQTPVPIRPDPV